MKKIYKIMLALLIAQSLYGAADNDPNRQLKIAIKEDNVQKAREAILNGAQLNVLDQSPKPAMMKDAWTARQAVLNGDDYQSPLDYAITQNKPKMVHLLLDNGANPNTVDAHGSTPLYKAVYLDDSYMVNLLIDNGADINAATLHGNTPLIEAIEKPAVDIIKLLIAKGADVNATDLDGLTPLYYAILNAEYYDDSTNEHLEIVTLLIDKGAKTDIVVAGDSLLSIAVNHEFIDIAKLLLDHGADININIPNIDGNTPLHLAVRKHNTDMVKLLLEYFSDDSLRNKRGQTALNIARERGYQDIVELLNQYEAPPTVKEPE